MTCSSEETIQNIGSTKINCYPRTGKRGVPQQFPRRLYEMLQGESEIPTYHSLLNERPIVHWSNSGIAFAITDVPMFSKLILPKFFKTSKFSSFQRNLNLYGFTKVRKGPDIDMYSHPNFIRGHKDGLAELRKRKKIAAPKTTKPNAQIPQQNTLQIHQQNSPSGLPGNFQLNVQIPQQNTIQIPQQNSPSGLQGNFQLNVQIPQQNTIQIPQQNLPSGLQGNFRSPFPVVSPVQSEQDMVFPMHIHTIHHDATNALMPPMGSFTLQAVRDSLLFKSQLEALAMPRYSLLPVVGNAPHLKYYNNNIENLSGLAAALPLTCTSQQDAPSVVREQTSFSDPTYSQEGPCRLDLLAEAMQKVIHES